MTDLTPVGDIWEALHEVIDPELGVNIVDLGLVYGVDYQDDDSLLIQATLTTPACPLQDVIEDQIDQHVGTMVDDWKLEFVWSPPWDTSKITPSGKEQLRALGVHI